MGTILGFWSMLQCQIVNIANPPCRETYDCIVIRIPGSLTGIFWGGVFFPIHRHTSTMWREDARLECWSEEHAVRPHVNRIVVWNVFNRPVYVISHAMTLVDNFSGSKLPLFFSRP